MQNVLTRNNVSISGDGEKTILFAHGFGCDQHVWLDILPAFSAEYRMVTFDYVGAGGSDLSAYDQERYSSLAGYAQDVTEICDELNIVNAVFVGHSVSSMIGVLASNARPGLFEKLVFLGPSPCYLNEEGYVGGFTSSDLDGLFEMMDSNYLGWSRSLAPAIMANKERPELGEKLTNSFCSTDPAIARQFARVTFLSDNRADIKKVSIPTLTLQCAQDIIAPIEVGHYLNQNMDNNTLVFMKASGHCSHMSAPEETISAIKEFLN